MFLVNIVVLMDCLLKDIEVMSVFCICILVLGDFLYSWFLIKEQVFVIIVVIFIIIVYWYCKMNDLEVVEFNEYLDYVVNYLYMINGEISD